MPARAPRPVPTSWTRWSTKWSSGRWQVAQPRSGPPATGRRNTASPRRAAAGAAAERRPSAASNGLSGNARPSWNATSASIARSEGIPPANSLAMANRVKSSTVSKPPSRANGAVCRAPTMLGTLIGLYMLSSISEIARLVTSRLPGLSDSPSKNTTGLAPPSGWHESQVICAPSVRSGEPSSRNSDLKASSPSAARTSARVS